MKLWTLFFVLAALLPAQVVATLSLIHHDGVRRLFDRRTAKAASLWVVSLENQSADIVGISEAAILRRIPQLQPIDSATMMLYLEDAGRNSPWSIAGRLTQDGIQLATVLAASEQIKVSQPILSGLTATIAFGPYLKNRIQGKQPPLSENFHRLGWPQILRLAPGESGTAHVFTAAWPDDTPAITVTIDTRKLQAVKLAQ